VDIRITIILIIIIIEGTPVTIPGIGSSGEY
jgi:hypothetical protein